MEEEDEKEQTYHLTDSKEVLNKKIILMFKNGYIWLICKKRD
jgi:hypothetical protein